MARRNIPLAVGIMCMLNFMPEHASKDKLDIICEESKNRLDMICKEEVPGIEGYMIDVTEEKMIYQYLVKTDVSDYWAYKDMLTNYLPLLRRFGEWNRKDQILRCKNELKKRYPYVMKSIKEDMEKKTYNPVELNKLKLIIQNGVKEQEIFSKKAL
jgi:hypothetical protein